MLNCEPSIADDATHSKSIDRVVTRNRQDSNAIRQDDVLSLTHESEAGFLQRSNRIQMIDTWDLWHA